MLIWASFLRSWGAFWLIWEVLGGLWAHSESLGGATWQKSMIAVVLCGGLWTPQGSPEDPQAPPKVPQTLPKDPKVLPKAPPRLPQAPPRSPRSPQAPPPKPSPRFSKQFQRKLCRKLFCAKSECFDMFLVPDDFACLVRSHSNQ